MLLDDAPYSDLQLRESTQALYLLIRIGSLTVGSSLFLAARVYLRLRSLKRLVWDDCFLILAWILLLICSGLIYMSCRYGFARPINGVPDGHIGTALMYLTIQGQVAVAADGFSQLSIASTLFNIAVTRFHKSILRCVINSVLLTKVLCIIFTFTWCTPASKIWSGNAEPGTCREISGVITFWTFSAVFSGLIDLILVVLPWYILWGLQMKRVHKVGLGITFAMGIFSAVTAFCEAASIPQVQFGGAEMTTRDIGTVVWTFAEPSVIIMAACVPFFHRPTEAAAERIQQALKRRFRTSRGSTAEPMLPLTTIIVPSRQSRVAKSAPEAVQRPERPVQRPERPVSGIMKTFEITVETRDRGERGNNQGGSWENHWDAKTVISAPPPTAKRGYSYS